MAIPVPALETLLAALRLHGVTRFSCGDWAIEFGAPFGVAPVVPAKAEFPEDRAERVKKEEEALLYASAGG